jgi:3-deoxy-D-manno-octulosonic-acid transferase
MPALTVRIAYNLVFGFLFALSLPWLLIRLLRRGQWREQFGQRFGRFAPRTVQALRQRPTIWLHAVSVGEANLVVRLASLLQHRLPEHQIVVSTTTTTGMTVLRRQLPDSIERIYYPLDLRGWVKRSLTTVRPQAIVLVEAEIWPNFLWRVRELRTPVLLVNARVSERSRRRYRKFGSLFEPLFAGFELVCCASPMDANRLRDVGCRADAIQEVGNLKFDISGSPPPAAPQVRRLLDGLGLTDKHTVLLGGSTHPGEERVLGQLTIQLRERFPRLFLIVVPRHFERAAEACRDLTALGLTVVRRSDLDRPNGKFAVSPTPNCDALVVDTTGELRAFYTRADIVFVGKSLTAHGGQNPIEPAVAGCAVVTGPNMENFPHVMSEFLAGEAVIQVRDSSALRAAFEDLLSHPEKRRSLGKRARDVVEAGRGALDRTVEAIARTVGESSITPPFLLDTPLDWKKV